MNILVTGSEGFIGSHLVESLVLNDHKVKCVILYNSFNNYGWLETLDKNIKKIKKLLKWKPKVSISRDIKKLIKYN